MNKYLPFIGVAVVLVLLISGLYVFLAPQQGSAGNYDSFAKCLTSKGVKMYGAFWCGHCNSQKEMFGSSFKHVTYVECSTPDGSGQLQVCKDAGIEGYPTWEFADGSRRGGEVALNDLSLQTGCPLQ